MSNEMPLQVDQIGSLIRTIRGQKVMLDSDLAMLYGVSTKALNQAVKRNFSRFPPDFLFQLTQKEVVTLNRSQIVTGSQRHRDPRFLPYAYRTEILPDTNTINHRIRHMTFSNVIQNGDFYEREGWDYLECNMWYGGTPDLPATFGGVSGGPVWGMQIKKDKSDGRLSIEKSALIGITFYQTELKGDERRLRAHFIKSIYDLAWRNSD